MSEPKKRISPFKENTLTGEIQDEQQMELLRKFKVRGTMAALDLTRDQPEEIRDLCVQVAMTTIKEVCLTLQGGSSQDDHGYYLIVHNEISAGTPTLTSDLVGLFDEINN